MDQIHVEKGSGLAERLWEGMFQIWSHTASFTEDVSRLLIMALSGPLQTWEQQDTVQYHGSTVFAASEARS